MLEERIGECDAAAVILWRIEEDEAQCWHLPAELRALEKLGMAVDFHQSRPLTREMVESADLIFAMTPAHLAEIKAIAPGAASKARLLSADGLAVPDPIGGPQRVYDEACRLLADLIAAQFKEMDR